MFALNACTNATSADPMMRTTIQWAWSACSNATAVGNCWLLFRLCQGATYETAAITTQKNVSPAKMVRRMATEKLRPSKFGLASSAHLPTDSKPDTSQGTTCQTSKMERSGAWLNNGYKLETDPCFAPASAKIMTRVRNVNVVV